ncbi:MULTISPECIES: 16S rRNA (cytosine(1402)-N(4))-methyltransferase RsmH [Eubacterium]|uniref:16S rRNA (cytosine(1402)-N(4))-methyltransferase RsmH n=1 Tax=Eubacterium TaxID=1730 RepID=UPI0009993EFA|nr:MULTISPECIES: 16S rRNA (cytosine(1402)-N(4))-methyltransferase RsmH [Eubacterium]MCR5368005.1 16S rRNA (cytosine(1402)-N(4))-methyltransferase RsmH [Eubacterium sp.]
MEFSHIPVLLNEVIENLNIKEDGTYFDGTLGGGGHSGEILKRLGPNGRLIATDQDREAIESTKERLKDYSDKLTIVKSNFVNVDTILKDLGIEQLDGILLDLGVSSYQLDNKDRGFSYREDAPLDMRMDKDTGLTAADIVNDYEERDLARVIRDYGEDPFAQKIARAIVNAREEGRITTTFQLNDIIKSALPAKVLRKTGHPAKQTYQAIRIELNHELEVLEQALTKMIDLLAPGGRICIITFHSLEDRIVKNIFKTAMNPCICPPEFPVCVCGRKSKGTVITRKPIVPSEEELEINSRSKSSKLRVFEKAL